VNRVYLKPWKSLKLGEHESKNRWYRHTLEGNILYASIASSLYGYYYIWNMRRPDSAHEYIHKGVDTLEKAMEKCDQTLLSYGYLLLTKEQVEKLSVLI
jgi:hypothetical protein